MENTYYEIADSLMYNIFADDDDIMFDGEEFKSYDEEKINRIAGFFDGLGYVAFTGKYEEEDNTGYTGMYYVTLD